jgi:hypothetical protein
MALANRTDARVAQARKALATGKVVAAAPAAAAGATPTKAEFDGLRQTVVDLRAALLQNGIVK